MAKIELIATAAFGLEAVVAKELKELGYKDQMVENGRITFSGMKRQSAAQIYGCVQLTGCWLK